MRRSNTISFWVPVFSKAGIKLNYSTGAMEWFECSIPLHPPGGLNSREFDAMEDMFHIQVEDKLLGHD
jgi:hypothetical protein